MPYRDATSAVEAEAAALEAARRADLAATPTGRASIYVRRTARIAFGVAGTLGAVAVAGSLSMGDDGYPTLTLLGAWGAAVITYVVAAIAAAVRLRWRLHRAVARHGDPFRDAAALRALDVRGIERGLASRHGRASHSWPLVAATLLGPHTLHLIASQVLVCGYHLDDFDTWMQVTAISIPHVFLYGVFAAWRFPLDRRVGRSIWIAAGLSLVPWVLALGLPSVIVLVTAAAVACLAYLPMGRIIDAEAMKLSIQAGSLAGE